MCDFAPRDNFDVEEALAEFVKAIYGSGIVRPVHPAAGAPTRGFWTTDRVLLLRAYWASNTLSGAQIARHIGHGCTRGMVLGKASRLGLNRRAATQAAEAA